MAFASHMTECWKYLLNFLTLSQHLTLHWLNLPIEVTHTQDEGFERDSRDQTCS
jgi:hypothetical protein